jgi:hypothetical protein
MRGLRRASYKEIYDFELLISEEIRMVFPGFRHRGMMKELNKKKSIKEEPIPLTEQWFNKEAEIESSWRYRLSCWWRYIGKHLFGLILILITSLSCSILLSLYFGWSEDVTAVISSLLFFALLFLVIWIDKNNWQRWWTRINKKK